MNLTDLLQDAITLGKKIDIVIGDGIDPMREVHDAHKIQYRDITHINPNRLYELDRLSWQKYEHVRHYTTNARPTVAYDLVVYLAQKNLLRSVVTTNYDSTLDTIFTRFKSGIKTPVSLNPVLAPDEWDYFGYCSLKSSPDSIELWKIHGSLNYVFCRGCSTLLKCPEFVMPFGLREITDLYNHPISHTYIPHNSSCCPITAPLGPTTGSICGHYVHGTDWNIPHFKSSQPFDRIITGAMGRLKTDPFGIIFLGFKGNKSYESINQVAEELDGAGVKWVMYLCEDQRARVESGPDHWHLRDIVVKNGGEFKYFTVPELALQIERAVISSRLADYSEAYDLKCNFQNRFIPQAHWERL